MKGKSYVHRSGNRPGDLYYTPFSLPWALLEYEQFSNCLEPAAGDRRAIVKAAKTAPVNPLYFEGSFDISDNPKDIDCNFLYLHRWHGDIWTNPPFSLWDDFVMHAKRITPNKAKICILGKTNFLGCQGRSKSGIWKNLEWIYVFNRYVDYQTPYREDGFFCVGNLCTAWFVWRKNYRGFPKFRILDISKYAVLGAYDELIDKQVIGMNCKHWKEVVIPRKKRDNFVCRINGFTCKAQDTCKVFDKKGNLCFENSQISIY